MRRAAIAGKVRRHARKQTIPATTIETRSRAVTTKNVGAAIATSDARIATGSTRTELGYGWARQHHWLKQNRFFDICVHRVRSFACARANPWQRLRVHIDLNLFVCQNDFETTVRGAGIASIWMVKIWCEALSFGL